MFACFYISLILFSYAFIVLSKRKLTFGSSRLGIKKKMINELAPYDEDIGGQVYQDALRILDQARSDSLKILGRAQVKAQGLLDSSYTISQENRKKLEENVQSIYSKQEKALDNLSEELLSSYREAIEEGKQENIRTLYEVTSAIKQEALLGVDEFKEIIKKETLNAQEALEEKIKAEYSRVDEEISEYKDKKIKSLNDKIFDILSNTYTKVIGQELDQVKYEKIILDMLKEEIEKSGIKKDS